MDTAQNDTAAAADEKAPGERLMAQLEGETPAALIDALHARHFGGSILAADTQAWNLVMAFVADVKQLLGEIAAKA